MKVARSAGVALLVGLIVVVSFLIYFRYHGAEWLGRRTAESAWRSGWRGKVVVLLEGFSEGLQGIRTWNDLAVLVGFPVVHWCWSCCVISGSLMRSAAQLGTLNLPARLWCWRSRMVGSAVQLPGVGGGAQVATFLVLTLMFGVEKVPAATLSIVGLAGHICIVLLGRVAAAVPRRMVHG